MKPIRLEFSGINSFSKPATIDFGRLLTGGIFGIFGDTGSGKTTILDSMIFALYGKVDRVRGGVGSEIINYNCDKAYAIFDFETEWKGKRRAFRVEREIKRKNSAQSLRLFELDGERIIAVSEGVKNTNPIVQDIVGLSFEDFKKCIALPQGEFAQFVKAEKSERLQLISRLFGLEKYGVLLAERLRAGYADAKSQYDLKNGELSGYADVDDETLSAMTVNVQAQRDERAALDETYRKLHEQYESVKTAFERAEQLRALESERASLSAKKDETELLRASLRRLPAAAEIVRLQKRIESRAAELVSAQEGKQRAQSELHKANTSLQALAERDAEESFARRLESCAASLAKLDYIAEDVKAIAAAKTELEELHKQYKLLTERREIARKALADGIVKENSAAEAVLPEDGDSLEAFLQKNLESSLLRAEYRKAFAYLQSKRAELHRDFQECELFKRVEAEIETLSKYVSDRLGAEKSDDLQELLAEYRERTKRREAAVAALHAAQVERMRAYAAAEEAERSVERIRESADAAAKRRKEAEEKVAAALGGNTDVSAMRRELLKERAALTEQREAARKQTEAARAAIAKSEAEIAKIGMLEQQLGRMQKEETAKLQALLAEAAFSDIGEAASLADRFPDPAALQREIDEYDRAVLAVQAKLRLLEEGGAVQAPTEEQYRAVETLFRACTEEKQRAAERFAVSERVLADMQARLKKKKVLESELAASAAQLELIAKLRELVRGNNFMEFVASEYLSDIAAQATDTLLRLTGGRYFIRYQQGFFVGDNLCGGELRGVNTLSGGETFLVSLSLALALSSAIYAKSLKPIEFFFLDEGFGTLDGKLVDVVIDSLEMLKNNHFSIGLISHVEELKHRIDHKIIVFGAAENGSSEIKINE